MSIELPINKPEALPINLELETYNSAADIKVTIEALEAGESILITKFYSNGLNLLKELKKHLLRKMPNKSFSEQRAFREVYSKLSNQVLVEVQNYKLKVRKSPEIGWFEKLYPGQDNFLLTFPQVQGMNSSWQWYQNGVPIPVLRNKLKPYYGTYFPTRFDHLILFDNWLKRYVGPKKSAMDIGVGCGVLSLQLVKQGFQKVFATDTNPNAIFGLKEFMGDTKVSRKIELDHGNLFGKFDQQSELIVFNPPWLPQSKDVEGMDTAIYYNDKLFPEFFAEAKKHLSPEGQLVLLFSNLGEISGVTEEHPIRNELAEGGRFQLVSCLNRKVKEASSKTKRDQPWKGEEEVELWILKHK